MAKYHNQKDLEHEIRELKREVRQLARNHRLSSATVGSLFVRDPDDSSKQMVVGVDPDKPIPGTNDPQRQFLINRQGQTTPAIRVSYQPTQAGGQFSSFQTLALFDGEGHNAIFFEDRSGVGIGGPPVGGGHFIPADTTTWPGTTSSTFTLLMFARHRQWQPGLEVIVDGSSPDATTTGEVRLTIITDDATVTTPAKTINPGGLTFIQFLTNVPGEFGLQRSYLVRVEARRTAGTGTVRAQVSYFVGGASVNP